MTNFIEDVELSPQQLNEALKQLKEDSSKFIQDYDAKIANRLGALKVSVTDESQNVVTKLTTDGLT